MKLSILPCFLLITTVLVGCQPKTTEMEVGPGVLSTQTSVSGQFNGFSLDTLNSVEFVSYEANTSYFKSGDDTLSVWSDTIDTEVPDFEVEGMYTSETTQDDMSYYVISSSEELLGQFLRAMTINGESYEGK